MHCPQSHRIQSPHGHRARFRVDSDRAVRALGIAPMCALVVACASVPPEAADYAARVERVERELPDDPAVRAQVDAVEAARARERGEIPVDTVELRLSDDYIDEHQIRVTARVRTKRRGEMRAQRDVLHAETEMAVTRLEETALERRAELCFPSVTALAREASAEIYGDYKARQQSLLAWSEDLRRSGMLNELDGARFELESRVKIATRAPAPMTRPETVLPVLPEIGTELGDLIRQPDALRKLVRRHHPSVALREATAKRYAALAARARSRAKPGIRFVDLTYERRTGERNEPGENGVGGQISFEVPLGARPKANTSRYQSLVSAQHREGEAIIEEQMQRSLQALADLQSFEANTTQWRELEALAGNAEQVADRWWRGRLAQPDDVAALLDEAYKARIAVLEARERAGIAECTLLAMTGVPLEEWPRTTAGASGGVEVQSTAGGSDAAP
jgi:hypothetical protein